MLFRWPVKKDRVRITVKFNQWYFLGRHKGLDLAPIDKKAPDLVIVASADWIECEIHSSRLGYGNHVILYHKDGWMTIYAHLSKIYIKPGWSKGKAGAMIGWMGNTGMSRGRHIHFEVRHKGVQVNPLLYLANF